MIRTRHTLAALTSALLLLPAGGAAAQTPTPSAEPAPELEARSEQRVDALCARVPNLAARTQNLLDRLPGDADERGSIAWVRQRADTARDAGREELATALDNRANLLTAKLEILPQRQELLTRAAQWCADADAAS